VLKAIFVALTLLASANAADAQRVNGRATSSPPPPPIETPRATRDVHGYRTCTITGYCLGWDGEWTQPRLAPPTIPPPIEK
jgi:hypothetical protein